MSTPWNKIYSVQNSQLIAQQNNDIPMRKANLCNALYPRRLWSHMDAAWPRYGPPRDGSPYERIPCRASEPSHSEAAIQPPYSERAAGLARDPSILMSRQHCARGEETPLPTNVKTSLGEHPSARAAANTRTADETASEKAQSDSIRRPADAFSAEGTDSPIMPGPAHSDESLCVADASGLFGDLLSEPIAHAPGFRIEPIPTRSPTFRMSCRRARGTRSPHEMTSRAREEAEAACVDQPSIDPNDIFSNDPRARGLLYYKKWWFLRKVGISVRGKVIVGTPIFLRENTLRVINDEHSYIIPIGNVDYIRTSDGLDAACEHFSDCQD